MMVRGRKYMLRVRNGRGVSDKLRRLPFIFAVPNTLRGLKGILFFFAAVNFIRLFQILS